MLLLPLLLACSNAQSPLWASGGTRHADQTSPQYGEVDTGGGGTVETGDTGYVLEEGAPELTSAAAVLVIDEYGDTTISARVMYVDAEDDLVGGNLYADVVSDTTYDNGDRDLVDTPTYDVASEAYTADGVIVFVIGDMNPTLDYQLLIQVRDASGHESNTVETTAPAISG